MLSNQSPSQRDHLPELRVFFFSALRLIKRLQSNPEYQDSIRYLIERMRSAFELGGLHAERMEQQLQGKKGKRSVAHMVQVGLTYTTCLWTFVYTETSEGREFLSETRQTKDHAIRLIERWTESSLDPLFTQINQLNDQVGSMTSYKSIRW